MELLKKATALGEAISLARVARDMTRQDCAERAHISPSTLVRIEKGDVSVSFSAWLLAMEQVGLVGLIEPAARPYNDVIGETRRKAEVRRRVHKTTSRYDF